MVPSVDTHTWFPYPHAVATSRAAVGPLYCLLGFRDLSVLVRPEGRDLGNEDVRLLLLGRIPQRAPKNFRGGSVEHELVVVRRGQGELLPGCVLLGLVSPFVDLGDLRRAASCGSHRILVESLAS